MFLKIVLRLYNFRFRHENILNNVTIHNLRTITLFDKIDEKFKNLTGHDANLEAEIKNSSQAVDVLVQLISNQSNLLRLVNEQSMLHNSEFRVMLHNVSSSFKRLDQQCAVRYWYFKRWENCFRIITFA